MPKRAYGQYCGLARALDVVGERWTLLVVRELIAGPKRYSDLLDALPGIGTSLLATRLQSLQAEGIIRRTQLPPPAASTVYELTEIGDELVEALLPLVGWGAKHFLGPRGGAVFRAEWPLLVLRSLIDPALTTDIADTYEFHLDGSVAHLRIDHGRIAVCAGKAESADVVVTTDLETFADLGLGRCDAAQALADGRLVLDGDPDALNRITRLIERAIAASA